MYRSALYYLSSPDEFTYTFRGTRIYIYIFNSMLVFSPSNSYPYLRIRIIAYKNLLHFNVKLFGSFISVRRVTSSLFSPLSCTLLSPAGTPAGFSHAGIPLMAAYLSTLDQQPAGYLSHDEKSLNLISDT